MPTTQARLNQLYQESLRRERWSSALAAVTTALLSESPDNILPVLAERVATVIEAELVCVIVPDAEDPFLRVAAACGREANTLIGRRYSGKNTLSGQAIATGKLASTDKGNPDESVLRSGSSAAIALPVRSGAETLGALTIYRSTTDPKFTGTERQMAAKFADGVALAIELSRGRADGARLALIEERSRIARELHDQVIQRLFGTGLALQALALRHPETADEIDIQVEAVDSAIAAIRTAIFALGARKHGETSLRHHLLDLVGEATPALGHTPFITFRGAIDALVDAELAKEVLAVVRESVANVARHAEATRTEVAVTVSDSQLVITVDDDGKGLTKVSKASGTRNLSERAERLGGSFELRSRESGGTRASWIVPLDQRT